MTPQGTDPRPRLAYAVECDICGLTMIGLAPAGAIEVQCLECGHFNPIPGAWDAIEAEND